MWNRASVRLTIFCCVVTLCGWHASILSAHFLFIRIGKQAEAGRAAEVFFSERAAAGDPRFIQKIAGTQLWMQSEQGKFVPLHPQQGTDRLRALVPVAGAVSVSGVCEYGVLEREVAFLLRYYPKAITGPAADVNQFGQNEKTPLEIAATIDQAAITLKLLDHGKPVPRAVFTTVDDSLANEELAADDQGTVIWKPPASGHYCIYCKVVRKVSGDLAGKKYSEIREFPTLAFHWPLERNAGDQQAIELFQKAIASRAHWHDFPGFAAQVEGSYDDRPFSGTARITKQGAVELKIDQEVAEGWAEDQLRSLVMHRLEPTQQNQPLLRFADQDVQHPLGRLLTFVGGRFASSYRVKDNQLTVVNRNVGSDNMTITVLENERTAEGKYLPRFYNVQYWDAASGQLKRTEAFENRWQRKGQFDLPTLNAVITSSSTGLSVRRIRLFEHQLLQGE